MDFLDYLTEQLGCAYLSDLHYHHNTGTGQRPFWRCPTSPSAWRTTRWRSTI